MNLLTFLERASQDNGLTVIDAEMMAFDLDAKSVRKQLSTHFGPELAKQISEAARPEFNRIRSIIARVQPGIDYYHSDQAMNEFNKELASLKSNSFWTTGEITGFARKYNQDFAFDNTHAYDITECIIYDANDDVAMYRRPLILHHNQQKYINYAWPEEGSAGGLAMVTCIDRPNKPTRPFVGFSKCRYIYTRELGMTAQQIEGDIVEEVLRGETPLTGGGLPGWI